MGVPESKQHEYRTGLCSVFSPSSVQMYESTFNFQLFVPGGGYFFRLLAFKIEVGVTTHTPLTNFLPAHIRTICDSRGRYFIDW
jgi:hypothetical protein